MLRNFTKMPLLNFDVKGVLLDITGVLFESGEKIPISGSIEAIEKLRARNIPFRFLTNETVCTRSCLLDRLKSLGFSISENEIFTPAVAVSKLLKQANLRPYLLVHPGLLPEFIHIDQSNPNCVVVGDAAEHFTYENMNRAFQILINSQEPFLISMGKGRYYQEKGELIMDLGGFTAALEYAAGVDAKIIGKPSKEFFINALNDMDVIQEKAVMVGDDIAGDIGGAQKCGIKGVLVKTGKFRSTDMKHPSIKPDAIVDNLLHFVNMISSNHS